MSARHREHLLLAAGERAGALPKPFLHARKERQHALVVPRDAIAVRAGECAHQQVLAHVMSPNSRASGTSAAPHDLGDREARERLPVEDDASGARLVHTEYHFHRGRHAACIAAEQADDNVDVVLERTPLLSLCCAVECRRPATADES